jgi:hypothetical protein
MPNSGRCPTACFSLSHKRFGVSYCEIRRARLHGTLLRGCYDQGKLGMYRAGRLPHLARRDISGFVRQACLCNESDAHAVLPSLTRDTCPASAGHLPGHGCDFARRRRDRRPMTAGRRPLDRSRAGNAGLPAVRSAQRRPSSRPYSPRSAMRQALPVMTRVWVVSCKWYLSGVVVWAYGVRSRRLLTVG